MKLQLVSDLHLEFEDDLGAEFLSKLEPEADVLVMAGDITTVSGLNILMDGVADRWRHVLYVMGNHEAYRSSIQDSWVNAIQAAIPHGYIHVLRNQEIVIDGVKFYGGTGWFPNKEGDAIWRANRPFLNDFNMIRDFEKECYAEHKEFEAGLYRDYEDVDYLHGSAAPADVVISHHLPDRRCVSPKYAGSGMNDFFVSGFDVEASRAKLWLFGHTHDANNLIIGDTRLVCNPRGYPGERLYYKPLLLEV